VTATGAWARLGAATAATAVLLLTLSPPQPLSRIPAATAAGAGLVVGATLSIVVAGKPRGVRASAARLALLALTAVNEELLWRRTLLGELLRGGALTALATSTLAFALAHRARPGLHVVTGAAFGGLYLATGALAAPVAAHWAYNAALASRGEVHADGRPP
jgi:membrane protease YdiL (CAAX protease family)